MRRIRGRAEIKDFSFQDPGHEATSRLFERGLTVMEMQPIGGREILAVLLRYTQMNGDRPDELDSHPNPPEASS